MRKGLVATEGGASRRRFAIGTGATADDGVAFSAQRRWPRHSCRSLTSEGLAPLLLLRWVDSRGSSTAAAARRRQIKRSGVPPSSSSHPSLRPRPPPALVAGARRPTTTTMHAGSPPSSSTMRMRKRKRRRPTFRRPPQTTMLRASETAVRKRSPCPPLPLRPARRREKGGASGLKQRGLCPRPRRLAEKESAASASGPCPRLRAAAPLPPHHSPPQKTKRRSRSQMMMMRRTLANAPPFPHSAP
jgi:hypothetical protein